PRSRNQSLHFRSFSHQRNLHRGLRNHSTQICGLVKEAGANPSVAPTARPARFACQAQARFSHRAHRTGHSARSRNAHDFAPPTRHHSSSPARHICRSRLRHLLLAVLRKSSNRHSIPPHTPQNLTPSPPPPTSTFCPARSPPNGPPTMPPSSTPSKTTKLRTSPSTVPTPHPQSPPQPPLRSLPPSPPPPNQLRGLDSPLVGIALDHALDGLGP